MQLNRRQNQQYEGINNQLSKSKSPDNMRQKIPAFRPKTLEQIFQQTKRKKSTYKFQKKNSDNDAQTNPFKLKNNQQKQSSEIKNCLADLIADSGHQCDIQSVEYTTSQIEEQFEDQDFDKYMTQQYKPLQKYALRVLTPQCESFSKIGKDSNPFACKDDSDFVSCKQKKAKHWNGQITLATSMCQDDFDAMKQSDSIPQDLQKLIDEKYYYVYCVNSQNQNQYLMQSSDPFELKQLMNKLIDLQNKSNKKYSDKQLQIPAQTIRFLSASDIDQFLAPDMSHQFIKKHLSDSILPKKKFTELIYFVQAQSKSK